MDYQDKRLKTLAVRLKARGFESWLAPGEREEWRAWVRYKLEAEEVPWRTMRRYESEVAALLETAEGRERETLLALKAHGDGLRSALGL